jgi:hypothetical protein
MDARRTGWQAPRVRRVALSVMLLFALGCEAPLIVDCDPGVFAQAGGVEWCVFDRFDTVRCPELLPIEHDLPWGGYACAAVETRPVPVRELCMVVDECSSDGGT